MVKQKNMKVLYLTVTKRWFDMILSGVKKEEYREIKGYWMRRLINKCDVDEFEMFDIVRFKNGYSKNSPTIDVEFNGIHEGFGRTEWGAAPGEKYFVIKLGKILSDGIRLEKE